MNFKFDRWIETCSLLWFWHTVLPLNFNGPEMKLSAWKRKPLFLILKSCKMMWKTRTHWKAQNHPLFYSSLQYPENRDILHDTGEWRHAHRCFPNAIWRVKTQEIPGLPFEGRLSKWTLDHNSKQWYLNATFPSLKLLETLFWLLKAGREERCSQEKNAHSLPEQANTICFWSLSRYYMTQSAFQKTRLLSSWHNLVRKLSD